MPSLEPPVPAAAAPRPAVAREPVARAPLAGALAQRRLAAPDVLAGPLARAVDHRTSTGGRPRVQRMTVPGTVAVTHAVGVAIAGNVVAGNAPFRPELGLGSCTWVLTHGNPYVGSLAEKDVVIPVRITYPDALVPLHFNELTLHAIYDPLLQAIRDGGYAGWRVHKNIPAGRALNSPERKSAEYWAKRAAEKQMWIQLGQTVAASAQRIGKVELRNSDFSRQGDGDFYAVADANMIALTDFGLAIVMPLPPSDDEER